LVADPFATFDVECFKSTFDTVLRFKDHYLFDITCSPDETVSPHHRYYARKALRYCHVAVIETPSAHLGDLVAVYETLVARHRLSGIRAFSTTSFAKQLEIPGLVMLRMSTGSACVGVQLWFVQDGVAYSHLTAFTE